MSTATTTLPPLEWQRMPLDGRVLIEASAGTGKTFNIGLIYLRLLLERNLPVEEILVTTFTEAAAQELRERLRRRLVEAERRLDGTQSAPAQTDSLEAWIDANYAGDRSALRRIQIARIDFDRAPIATIHGLCRRIQRDYPLESGAAFATDKLVDEKSLLRECVEDFWRRRYLGDTINPREATAVLREGPEALVRDLGGLLEGSVAAKPVDGEVRIQHCIEKLRGVENVAELRRLGSDKKLYGPRKTALGKRLVGVANMLESGDIVVAGIESQLKDYFSPEEIDEQQSDAATLRLRDHPLIGALQSLRDVIKCQRNFARGAVLAAAREYCREELPRRARQRDVQTFSMLIDSVHARLCGIDADAVLAERLFEAFPAALIDEFQDTDQRQFEIFDRIYRDGARAARGMLLMIGDPKQAIFGFRGGDIAAYLRASEHAQQRYSLAINRRSSAALVGVLNALYGSSDGGFDDPRIRYRDVQAGGKTDLMPYTSAAAAVTRPLSMHFFRGDARDAKGELVNTVGPLEKIALADCADRIAELLNDAGRKIGGQRVSPGDIAVLVPTNVQIVALRKLFAARGVPCVGSGRASVFDSDVARDLELILYGVLNAEDDRAVRGALSTRLLGARFADFIHWQEDAQAFESELERFATWRELARSRGVLALIDALLTHRGASLLAAPDGERAITDLRHLGELLAEEESARHGLDGLYSWFASMRRDAQAREDDDDDAMQARQLRVESDSRRVQLLTLHASKGLEFPIVFLPLIWRTRDRGGNHAPNVLRFHDAAGNECIDFGSADFVANRGRHFREDLRERLRLLYVGLTRAKYAAHVYWVDRGKRVSRDDQIWEVPAIGFLIRHALPEIGATAGEAGLEQLAARHDCIAAVPAHTGEMISYQPAGESESPRAAREPLPALRAFQWLHSFSGLVRQTRRIALESGASDEAEPEVSDADSGNGEEARDEAEDQRLLVLQSLRGPRFGEAVHKVLERAHFGRVWPEQRALLTVQLAAQAVRARDAQAADLIELVGRLVDRVRDADLGAGLRLAGLTDAERVIEFEFQFSVQHVSLARLRALCAQHGCATVVPMSLQATTLNGMLTGFVDLIFIHAGRYHVLDYKTNRLGERLSDYAPAALDAAMSAHHYDLQALLYTVALHRYLAQRLDGYTPEQHLGENWYLFLRAVGLHPGLGVWRRQWPSALIRALDDAFAGVHGAAA
jgi:exodeoxyribonuclease V beta subunit